MVTYTEVYTQLNTYWEVGVIAKPTFRNGQLGFSAKYPNFLFIRMQGAPELESMTMNRGMEKRVTTFELIITAKDRVDLDKHIQQARKWVLSKSVTGGWWKVIDQPKYIEIQKRVIATLLCQEIKAITLESW